MFWELGGGSCLSQDRIGAQTWPGFKSKSFQYLEAVGAAQHRCGSFPPLVVEGMVWEPQGIPVPSSWQGLRCQPCQQLHPWELGPGELLAPPNCSSHSEQLPQKCPCGDKVLKSGTARTLMSPGLGTVSVRVLECQLLCKNNQTPAQRQILQGEKSQRNKFW